jgi:hypothetical protein
VLRAAELIRLRLLATGNGVPINAAAINTRIAIT